MAISTASGKVFRRQVIYHTSNYAVRSPSNTAARAAPIVRDLFGKGLYEPMELIALEALLERRYTEPLPKKNAKGHITGIPPPTSTGQASQNAA